jgi:hypothetical protein
LELRCRLTGWESLLRNEQRFDRCPIVVQVFKDTLGVSVGIFDFVRSDLAPIVVKYVIGESWPPAGRGGFRWLLGTYPLPAMARRAIPAGFDGGCVLARDAGELFSRVLMARFGSFDDPGDSGLRNGAFVYGSDRSLHILGKLAHGFLRNDAPFASCN